MANIVNMNGEPTNIIPPITDPLGRGWDQPSTDNWLIDDESVIMSNRDFEKLHEYSCTNPTALYAGKCWRRHVEISKRGIDKWYLCFVTDVLNEPRYVDINTREILIMD